MSDKCTLKKKTIGMIAYEAKQSVKHPNIRLFDVAVLPKKGA